MDAYYLIWEKKFLKESKINSKKKNLWTEWKINSIHNFRSFSFFLTKLNRTWFWCPNNGTINIPCFRCNSWDFKEICRIRSQVSHHKTNRLFPHRADLTPGQCAGWMCSAKRRCNSTEGRRRAGGTPQKRLAVLLVSKGNSRRNNHRISLGKEHHPFSFFFVL